MPARPGQVRAGRGSKNRQRQRLIDACISALHIHGPSRTTVEKVVAIANLSPGIVRFYFRSKAAMLVASLQFLATEFDERVLAPVSAMRDTPVQAMRRLVELYLDPDLASPRKISVWYAFWGEATARQEYYEICGQKDDSFVVLVRDLMGRLVARSGARHLDAEALSLGFIGLLEVLWQGFAFQSEADIDRTAARERCLAYLRSVFPGQFDANEAGPPGAAVDRDCETADGFRRECLWLATRTAQLLGHERDLPVPGDARTVTVAATPMMLVRAGDGRLRLYANRCTHAPHDLLTPGIHRNLSGLACPVHGLAWDLAGRPERDGTPLSGIALQRAGGLLYALADEAPTAAANGLVALLGSLPDLAPLGTGAQLDIACDWKLIVEHWLDVWLSPRATARLGTTRHPAQVHVDPSGARVDWGIDIAGATGSWSLRRLAVLAAEAGDTRWSRHFIAPNALIERHAGGVSTMVVHPSAPGISGVVCRHYAYRGVDPRARALTGLAERLWRPWLASDRSIVESVQRSVTVDGGAQVAAATGTAIAAFRGQLALALR